MRSAVNLRRRKKSDLLRLSGFARCSTYLLPCLCLRIHDTITPKKTKLLCLAIFSGTTEFCKSVNNKSNNRITMTQCRRRFHTQYLLSPGAGRFQRPSPFCQCRPCGLGLQPGHRGGERLHACHFVPEHEEHGVRNTDIPSSFWFTIACRPMRLSGPRSALYFPVRP
jgi:hypothetical protein